jgi:glycosyltransferase involved in cell wall biosynthesis
MLPLAPSSENAAGPETAEARQAHHIAIFIFALTAGGAQRRTLTLARGFAERGHRVDLVVVSDEGALAREIPPGVRNIVLHSGWKRVFRDFPRRLNLRGLETLGSIPSLVGYLRRERPEVLLSAASHVNLVSLWSRRLAGIPVRLVLRASNDPLGYPELWPRAQRVIRKFLRWMAGRTYPWADAIIAVSHGVADDVARLADLPRERITVIYNPVTTPELAAKAREPVAHPWLAPGGPPLLLGVGKLKIQKDFPTLIRAFAHVRRLRPARLVILGEGGQRGALEALVRELGLEADVLLPGHVENPWAWMARASLFVLSSAWEGLPGVLIEALACGCPVVSTNCASGPSEVLEAGAYGPLVPVRDGASLAEAILRVLAAPPDPERLRARAAAFSVDPAVDAYLDVLLARGAGSSRT